VSGVQIRFSQRARKEMKALSRADQARIIAAVERLAADPSGADIKKLKATRHDIRQRVVVHHRVPSHQQGDGVRGRSAGAGDVLVAFSTSGKSRNIVRALETARDLGIQSIALLGKGGGPSKGLATWELIVTPTSPPASRKPTSSSSTTSATTSRRRSWGRMRWRPQRIDAGITHGYTLDMKTAISVPDEVFAQAEEAAKALGVSRSELYTRAVREYLRKTRDKNLTDRVNRTLAQAGNPGLDPVLMEMQLESLPREEW